MSLKKWAECLNKAVAAKALSREDADVILNRTKSASKRHKDYMSLTDAERTAVDAESAALVAERARQKRVLALQIMKTAEIQAAVKAHPKGVHAAAMGILSRDITGEFHGGSVEYRADSITRLSHTMIQDIITPFKHKMAGFGQNRAGLRATVREVFGQGTGDAVAAKAAKAWKDVAEYLRVRFNRAGGDIGHSDLWRMPQSHNSLRVKKAGYDEWARMFSQGDKDLMMKVHDLNAAELDAALKATFSTISSDGLNKLRIGPGGVVGGQGKKLANRRGDPRFLHFADADSWLAYHEKFGQGNVFDAMTGHIKEMSRDIALLEVLGPNPEAMTRMLKSMAEQAGEKWSYDIDRVYDVVSGKASVAENQLIGRVGGGIRSTLTAAQLGSAVLSAVTDFGFLAHAAHWNGLSATATLSKYVKQMNPTNGADRALARRLGVATDTYLGIVRLGQRYGNDYDAPGFIRWTADAVLRASGLAAHTDAGKIAFRLEMLGTFADMSKQSWGKLPEKVRGALERGGLDETGWNAARQFNLIDHQGAKFLDPVEMIKNGSPEQAKAGQAIHDLILQETAYAIPEPDARVRAQATFGTHAGSASGELVRAMMQYKSFGISVAMTNLGRITHQGSVKSRIGNTASLVIATTLLGGLALQFRQIANGKDPRDMADKEFWGEALFQGGGFGIVGDFVRSSFSRSGDDLVKTLAGPTAGAMTDLLRLTSGQMRRALDGDDTNFASEAIRFTQRYTPGSSLWYGRMIMDRAIFSQLRQMADPRAAQQMRRMEEKARKDYGQGFFWRPSQSSPDSGPDMGAAFGS